MRLSHETIYQTLFDQARGASRKELTAHLRTGRSRRKPHRRTNPGGQILDMVLSADRPAVVDDRAIPGHWEGDLILGKGQQSTIATLVERTSKTFRVLDRPPPFTELPSPFQQHPIASQARVDS